MKKQILISLALFLIVSLYCSGYTLWQSDYDSMEGSLKVSGYYSEGFPIDLRINALHYTGGVYYYNSPGELTFTIDINDHQGGFNYWRVYVSVDNNDYLMDYLDGGHEITVKTAGGNFDVKLEIHYAHIITANSKEKVNKTFKFREESSRLNIELSNDGGDPRYENQKYFFKTPQNIKATISAADKSYLRVNDLFSHYCSSLNGGKNRLYKNGDNIFFKEENTPHYIYFLGSDNFQHTAVIPFLGRKMGGWDYTLSNLYSNLEFTFDFLDSGTTHDSLSSHVFYIDGSPPELPQNIEVQLKVRENVDTDFDEVEEVQCFWPNVSDMPDTHYAGVMMYVVTKEKYNAEGTHAPFVSPLGDSPKKEDLPYNDALTTVVHSYDFSEPEFDSTGGLYEFAVTTMDALLNDHEFDGVYNWGTVDIFIPPSDLSIVDVVYGEPGVYEENGNSYPFYPVEVYVNKDEGLLELVEKLNIYYKETNGNYVLFHTAEPGTGYSEVLYTDQNGITSLCLKLNAVLTAPPGERKKHAHKNYFFLPTMVLKHAAEDGSPVEIAGAGSGGGEVPNLSGYKVIVKAPTVENPDYSGTVDLGGASNGEAPLFQTRQAVKFATTARDDGLEWYDAEGDILSLTLKSINKFSLTDEIDFGTRDSESLIFYYNQDVHCYVEVRESYMAGEEWKYKIRNTLFFDGPDEHGILIKFDLDDPLGKFQLTNAAGHDINMEFPVNTIDVRLKMDPGDFTGGDLDFYVWNIDASGIDRPAELTSIELAYIYNNTEPVDVEDSRITKPVDSIESFEWALAADGGLSDNRIVGMRIVDPGEADCFVYGITRMDTTRPEPASNISDTMTADEVFLSWMGSPDENVTYDVDFKAESMTGWETVSGLTRMTTNFDISDLGYNERIEFLVYAVDRAGNRSRAVPAGGPYIIYTPVYLGDDVQNAVITQDYLKTGENQYNRYVTWRIENGIVSGYEVAVEPAAAGEVEVDVQYDGNGALFTVNGLDSLTGYGFTVMGIDGRGKNSAEIVLSYNMQNYRPGPPDLLEPGNFSKGNGFSFKWNPAHEPDVQDVRYRLLVKESSAVEFTELASLVNENEYYYEEAEGSVFSHNADYVWKIEVEDIPGNGVEALDNESQEGLFKVDNGIPEIEVGEYALYIKDDLNIFINPSLCEILQEAAVYSTSDGSSGEVEALELLTAGEFAGWYSAVVPLHHSDEPYDLTVNVVNSAGTFASKTLNALYVDKLNPVISSYVINEPGDGGVYYSGDDSIDLELMLNDNPSGIHAVEYVLLGRYDDDPEAVESSTVVVSENSGETAPVEFGFTIPAFSVTGESVYIGVRAVDHALNRGKGEADSGYMVLPEPVVYDPTPPELTAGVTGTKNYSSENYFKAPGDLMFTYTHADEESGIAGVEYSVTREGEEKVWSSWEEILLNITPVDGELYKVSMKVVNHAGLETIYSESLIFDSTGPLNPGLVYNTDVPYVAGEAVSISASADDTESPIVKYRLAIGSGNGNTEVSSLVAGNVGGWLETSGGGFVFIMPDVKGVFIMSLEVENAAGVTRISPVNYPVAVTDYYEKVIVLDAGRYRTATDNFPAEWKYAGTEEITGYRYRINGPGYEEEAWSPETVLTGITLTGLSLAPGGEYRMEVKALYENELMGEVTGISRGVIIDPTAPLIPAETGLVVPAACYEDNFIISWDVTEEESSICSVSLLLEILDESFRTVGPGMIDLIPSAAGSQLIRTDAEGKKLAFDDGERIYATIRVTNGAGLISEKRAPVILFDNSPPEKPRVMDDGTSIRLDQVETKGLDFSWIWSVEDKESGIKEYQWQPVVVDRTAHITIEEMQDTLLTEEAWKTGDGSKTLNWTGADLPGHDRVAYLFVKAINNAGLTSVGCSNGIIADADGPWIAGTKLLQANDTTEKEQRYINSTENLWLHIDAVDLQSGDIEQYRGQYGLFIDNEFEAAGTSYESQTTPFKLGNGPGDYPVMTEGEIVYFKGSCTNSLDQQADPVSEEGYTGGVVLDTRLPVVETLTASYLSGDLLFDWSASAPFSPIKEYGLKLWLMEKNESGFENLRVINEWTGYRSKKLTINVDIYNSVPDLQEEIINGFYKLSVTAVSAAGNQSVERDSGIILYDTTAPEIDAEIFTVDDRNEYAYDSLDIRYSVTDNAGNDNVNAYYYRIGTLNDPDLFTGDWVEVITDEINPLVRIEFNSFAGGFEGVIQGTVMYVEIQAKDEEGNRSAVKSESVKVDKTAALVRDLDVANKYISSREIIYGLSFGIDDEESGIVEYKTAVASDKTEGALNALLADNALWQSINVAVPETTITEEQYSTGAYRDLVLGESCYVVLMAKNSVGLWSEGVYSEEIIIDYEIPEIIFYEGNNGIMREDEYVYNLSPFSLNYALSDSVSPEVYVEMLLLNQAGAVMTDENGIPLTPALGWKEKDISELVEQNFDEGDYQSYKLLADIHDKAGNILHVEKTLRVNRPPAFTYDNLFETTPGKPVTVSATIEDPDDTLGNFTYQWELTDYPHLYDEFHESWTSQPAPELVIYHRENPAHKTEYTLRLTVTDSDGKSSNPVETTITVYNTTIGDLYADEYWVGEENGVHIVSGTVTVPPEFKLTILPVTSVEVLPEFVSEGYSLRIDGELEIKPGVVLKLNDTIPPPYWKGIHINGTANIEGAEIRHAERGITIESGSTVVLTDTVFDDNIVGIHVLEDGQKITGCTIRNSYYYGIKEEKDVTPIVKDNTFSGNNINYYHKIDGSLSMDELNELDGNGENKNE